VSWSETPRQASEKYFLHPAGVASSNFLSWHRPCSEHSSMMPAINSKSEFGRVSRLPTMRAKLPKNTRPRALRARAFRHARFCGRKNAGWLFFAAWRAESLLGLFLLDLKAPNFKFTSLGRNAGGLLDLESNRTLSVVRPFESLPLDLFRRGTPRFSKFEPGIGSYFPDDTIGRSRTSGAGLEENRWIFFKLKFRF